MATFMICTVLVSFVTGACYGIYMHIQSKYSKNWKYFLCHHKGGAGAFARLLKMHFLDISSGKKFRVWLDCDDLLNLDKLFDYVGESDNVVVLMSKELLTRRWCIGELTTAHLKSTNL